MVVVGIVCFILGGTCGILLMGVMAASSRTNDVSLDEILSEDKKEN